MISSEQCKWCERDIFVVGSDVDFRETIWAHVGTGSVRCHFDNDDLTSPTPTAYRLVRRATPEDAPDV